MVSILSETRDELNLILENVDLSVINALRRVSICEVPTFAVESTNIEVNTSVLMDEYITQRMEMIPLKCSEKIEDDAIEFTLDVFGRDVTTTDLKSNDTRIFPFSNDIVIIKLSKDQHLKLTCRATKGIGRTHAKWNTICSCSFKCLEPNKFSFTLETSGTENCENVFLSSIKILKQKLQDLQKTI